MERSESNEVVPERFELHGPSPGSTHPFSFLGAPGIGAEVARSTEADGPEADPRDVGRTRREARPHILCRRPTTACLPIVRTVLAAFLGVAAFAAPVGAQSNPTDALPGATETRSPVYVTLEGWDRRVRLAVWDRSHAYGGLFYDRGLLRRWTPKMDDEYTLDLDAIRPTPADDARFYSYPNGFRTSAGSITTVRFAIESEFRMSTPLAGPLSLEVRGVQQEDLQARRAAVELGYHVEVGRGHRLGVRHSFASAKEDLDLELVYGYETARLGVEVSAGRLDVINNVVHDKLNPVPQQADTLRVYETPPYWLATRLTAPVGPVRFEATGGLAPSSHANVRVQTDEQVRFAFDSGFAYGGALAEAEVVGPALVVGAIVQGARSASARATPPDAEEPADYASQQTEQTGGLFGLGRWRFVRAEAWWTRSRVTDRQEGTAFGGSTIHGPYDIEERWTKARLRCAWTPGETRGPTLGLEYLASLRSFPNPEDEKELREAVTPALLNASHHRLTAQVGYRFSPRSRVTFGASYDVDGDPAPFNYRIPPTYDGAYVRLQASW